jgi:tRNA-Thr(GGU) m(6)t(6)A37 methyltransferase TsaA
MDEKGHTKMTHEIDVVRLEPIGMVHTQTSELPRHWSVSDVEGILEIDPQYETGLADIQAGQYIIVLFHFHRSPSFDKTFLKQTPPRGERPKGVFSICSPRRPNPIGHSVLKVTRVEGCRIWVKGLDMLDGTPILDIKPYTEVPK